MSTLNLEKIQITTVLVLMNNQNMRLICKKLLQKKWVNKECLINHLKESKKRYLWRWKIWRCMLLMPKKDWSLPNLSFTIFHKQSIIIKIQVHQFNSTSLIACNIYQNQVLSHLKNHHIPKIPIPNPVNLLNQIINQ